MDKPDLPNSRELCAKEKSEISAPFNFSLEELDKISDHLARSILEVCKTAKSGHIGGSLSSVELMTVLYFGNALRYDPTNLRHPDRDYVAVRGHLGPLRYSIFELLGGLSEDELKTYRTIGSRLQGHEEWQGMPGVDLTPSGSLGMILSYGVGAAVSARNECKDRKHYIFLGDGEEQEGNISEAARHAASLKLDNLIVILDKNTKQLSNITKDCDGSDIAKVWEGYGWDVVASIDGHNLAEVQDAYNKATKTNKPALIIANTVKGNRVQGAEAHFSGYHTIDRASPVDVDAAIESHEKLPDHIRATIRSIARTAIKQVEGCFISVKPNIPVTFSTPTNLDAAQGNYFDQLHRFMKYHPEIKENLYFLTADVTQQHTVKTLRIDETAHYINVGIREQHMIAMTQGLSIANPGNRIIVNSFDAFTYRSLDQLNAIAQGSGSIIVIGDISGLTNARNGKSHQSSGQPGALINMPGVTMLEPADNQDLFNCLNWAIGESRGVVFIRNHRSNVPNFLPEDKDRNLESYILYKPKSSPVITAISSGFTSGPLLKVVKDLDNEGIGVNAVNIVNNSTIDGRLCEMVVEDSPLVTFYNGNGKILSSAIAGAILSKEYSRRPSSIKGYGFEFGTTGTPEEVAKHLELDEEGIRKNILLNI